MAKWGVLGVLATAQFLMVLDQAVMNVAISQLVEDFDTTVTTIQMVIALYALVMAGLMLTGGKLGDLFGRRRAFAVGLCIYAVGSGLTAASWSVPSLMFGWSILEGIGAALVLPAMVALVAGNYRGADRAIAYGVLGGVAGAGIAVGPILGGWATTEFTWRLVFVGEVIVSIGILIGTRLIKEAEREGPAEGLDWVGSVLSASGLALIVFGVLQASNWGWLRPLSSPIEPFGFSLTPFVIAAGAVVLGAFVAVGAPAGGAWPGAARAPASPADPHPAGRDRNAARPEHDPDGDLLHDPALPADRPGPRRAGNRGADAADLGRPVRHRARRLGAGGTLRPADPGPGGAADHPARDAAPARHDRTRSSTTAPSWSRWASSGSAWAWSSPSSETSSNPRSATTTAVRPEGSRTPPSSSAPRSGRPCSARS